MDYCSHVVRKHQHVPQYDGACEGKGWMIGVGAGVVHYGLTGGWVQEFKASYLAYFLKCALTDYDSGKA